MSARHDWIAIGPHGVYALMDAQLATPRDVSSFRAKAGVRGHSTKLVTVDEACRLHLEFLARCGLVPSVVPAAGEVA